MKTENLCLILIWISLVYVIYREVKPHGNNQIIQNYALNQSVIVKSERANKWEREREKEQKKYPFVKWTAMIGNDA